MGCEPLQLCDFIQLWRRSLPRSYTTPIEEEASGRGFDVPHAQARIWAEFCEELEVSQQAYFLKPHSIQTRPHSTGPIKSTGEVEVTRAAPTEGDIVLFQGQSLDAQFLDSVGNELLIGRFLVSEETTIPEGSNGPFTVPVEAQFAGFAGNVPAETVTQFTPQGRFTVFSDLTATNRALHTPSVLGAQDRFIGEDVINRYVRLVDDPGSPLVSENARIPRRVTGIFESGGNTGIVFEPALDNAADVGKPVAVELEEMEDLGLTVINPSPILGGSGDTLGAIGADRNQGRIETESDEDYRNRLCALDDTISPGAIKRILDRLLSPKNIDWSLKEPGDFNSLSGFILDFHPFDYGQLQPIGNGNLGQGAVLLDESTYVRFFIICVSNTRVENAGAAYDQPINILNAPAAYSQFFYDGTDFGFDQCILEVWEAINAARAAGVGFIIIRQ